MVPYSNWYKTCFLINKYNNYAKISKYKQILLKYLYISLPCNYRHNTIDMIGSFYLFSPLIKNHDKRMVKQNVNWLTNETIVELAASVCCSLLIKQGFQTDESFNQVSVWRRYISDVGISVTCPALKKHRCCTVKM